MGKRALLLTLVAGLATFAPAEAKHKGAQSNNPNVKRAMKKAKKVRPKKYKARKAKRSAARYGVKHT